MSIKETPRTLDNERLTARHLEVNAQFRTLSGAQRAVWQVADLARAAYLPQVMEHAESAPWRPDLKRFARTGLLFGIAGGFVFAMIEVLTRFTGSGLSVPPANLVALSFLVTGVAGAVGWLIGLVFRAYQMLTGARAHTLKAVVTQRSLSDVEQTLFASGAQTVWVLAGEEELNGEFE